MEQRKTLRQKPPLKLQEIWTIRIHLQMALSANLFLLSKSSSTRSLKIISSAAAKREVVYCIFLNTVLGLAILEIR